MANPIHPRAFSFPVDTKVSCDLAPSIPDFQEGDRVWLTDIYLVPDRTVSVRIRVDSGTNLTGLIPISTAVPFQAVGMEAPLRASVKKNGNVGRPVLDLEPNDGTVQVAGFIGGFLTGEAGR